MKGLSGEILSVLEYFLTLSQYMLRYESNVQRLKNMYPGCRTCRLDPGDTHELLCTQYDWNIKRTNIC